MVRPLLIQNTLIEAIIEPSQARGGLFIGISIGYNFVTKYAESSCEGEWGGILI